MLEIIAIDGFEREQLVAPRFKLGGTLLRGQCR